MDYVNSIKGRVFFFFLYIINEHNFLYGHTFCIVLSHTSNILKIITPQVNLSKERELIVVFNDAI